jgi:hypothetical protein
VLDLFEGTFVLAEMVVDGGLDTQRAGLCSGTMDLLGEVMGGACVVQGLTG